MSSLIINLLSVFILAPVFLFFIIFFVSNNIVKNQQKAIRLSADISTVFFIFAVYFLIFTIWEQSVFLLLVGCLLLLLAIFSFIYWRMKGEFDYTKILRGFWRFSFLIFSLIYFVLLIYGVSSSAFSSLRAL